MSLPIGKCRLRRSVGETCGLTAVVAVIGQPTPVVRAALQAAVAERGQSLAVNSESRFRDQLRAIERLGGELFDLQGNRFHAADISAERRWSASELTVRPTVNQFLAGLDPREFPDPLIVHATRPKGDGSGLESHTFALDRGWYFDNNLNGEPVPMGKVPAVDELKKLLDMRVIDVAVVRLQRGRRRNAS